ncbi:hypothetical protein RFI_23769, partial [Reticulomyxa filosa]
MKCITYTKKKKKNGVTFTRRMIDDTIRYSVDIWLEKGSAEASRRLNEILKKYCVGESITTFIHQSKTSARISTQSYNYNNHKKKNKKDIKEAENRYRTKQFESFEKNAASQKPIKEIPASDFQSLFATVLLFFFFFFFVF